MPRKRTLWFRFYVEAIHDRKLRRQPYASRWIWIAVLALARQSPEPGVLMVAKDEPVLLDDVVDAAAVKKPEAKSALAEFERLGMLDQRDDDGAWVVTNWGRRQFEGDVTSSSVPPDVRDEVFARDGFECVECHSIDDLTVDHIIPVTRGGTDDMDNLQTLCRPCNSRKGNRERQRRYRERQKERDSDGSANGDRDVTRNGESDGGSQVTAPRAHAVATEAKAETEETPSAGGAREALAAAISTACRQERIPPPGTRSHQQLEVAAADIAAQGGQPHEVPGKAREFRRQWPDATLTPMALAKHWLQLVPDTVDSRPEAKGYDPTPALRAAGLEEIADLPDGRKTA